MPRTARHRSAGAIYHIMGHSIPELTLFRNSNDKTKFLSILNDAYKELNFSIVAYCLMDTHYHLIVDSKYVDIATIMRKINVTYAKYYNDSYLKSTGERRKGPLFKDRYLSKIINKENYLLKATLYIHNNPKDMISYANRPEAYPFSSLRYYTNLSINPHDFLDISSVQCLYNDTPKSFSTFYQNLFHHYTKYTEYYEPEASAQKCSHLFQEKLPVPPEKIINTLCQFWNITEETLFHQNDLNTLPYRSILAVLLRCFCNLTRKNIASILGDLTDPYVYMLIQKGIAAIGPKGQRELFFSTILSSIRD